MNFTVFSTETNILKPYTIELLWVFFLLNFVENFWDQDFTVFFKTLNLLVYSKKHFKELEFKILPKIISKIFVEKKCKKVVFIST